MKAIYVSDDANKYNYHVIKTHSICGRKAPYGSAASSLQRIRLVATLVIATFVNSVALPFITVLIACGQAG